MLHKKIGKIFGMAMVVTGLCAFVLSYLHPNIFLFIVGIFTIYLTVTGMRMIQLKNIYKGQKPKIIDYIMTFFMAIAAIAFVGYGLMVIVSGNYFGLIFLLFGFISFRLCYVDYKFYTHKVDDKLYWLKNHLGRMTGAYIAALTAFLVVNNTFLPSLMAWSLPTIIGLVFIIRTIRKLNISTKFNH
jgi:hypothetical protein